MTCRISAVNSLHRTRALVNQVGVGLARGAHLVFGVESALLDVLRAVCKGQVPDHLQHAHLCPRQYPAGLRYRTRCDMARLPLQVLGGGQGGPCGVLPSFRRACCWQAVPRGGLSGSWRASYRRLPENTRNYWSYRCDNDCFIFMTVYFSNLQSHVRCRLEPVGPYAPLPSCLDRRLPPPWVTPYMINL